MRDGWVDLEEADIREGAFLVKMSRKICRVLVEIEEFEHLVCKRNPKMPKTFFQSGNRFSMSDKAAIFAVHFMNKSKALTKNVNQSIKKNHSFKSFGIPITKVIEQLKIRKLIEVISDEELDDQGRRKKRYRITYNSELEDHEDFMLKYQAVYPGNNFN